jgi:dihydroorotase/N-acyl-D-amino-acid deacylase
MLTALLNGTLADGTGSELVRGDLLIRDGRIVECGSFAVPSDAELIECSRYVVAPGFIDAHSHSDLQVLGRNKEKLLQGVTAEVVGNCGFSPYPAGEHVSALREFANGIFCGEGSWGWSSADQYLHDAEREAPFASVYSLIGHGSLRIAMAGNRMDALPEDLIQRMESVLDEALVEGAVGFSTGLMYAPGSSAGRDELERLCRIVAKRGKIYCTHMRDYGFRLLEAIDEQIELAKATGCRLQISHLQAVGRANRHLNQAALERIERAKDEGVDVAFDCYPYIAGSTVMTQLLPQWSLEGGAAALLQRLQDVHERSRIATETRAAMVHEWSELFVSAVGSEKNAASVGKSLEQIAAQRSCDPIDAMFDLLIEENAQVNILEFNQSEENLRANMTHPLALIISDGFYVKGNPHPRLHGTFPELLGTFCREKGWLDLPSAIHKVTGFPAERFRIKDVGLLRAGYVADIAVFDPETIRSHATYTNPRQKPEGMMYVIRRGQVLFRSDDRSA